MENLSVNVRITCKHLLYPEKEAKIWTNFYYSTEEKKISVKYVGNVVLDCMCIGMHTKKSHSFH